jgi:excisionase family DNA binding protein
MANVKSLLTPKELAEVIGASESSLRRWVDGGRIRMSRTAGGHRRIPLAEAIRFIRETGATIVRPELLGLGELHGADWGILGKTDDEQLFGALADGDANGARGLILSWYLGGRSLPALFDGPIRAAMHKVGDLWRHDPRGILVEHRATEICASAVDRLRDLIPPPAGRAPLALGGAPAGDPYVLPTRLAGLVLAEAGFRDVNFGPNTPVELLATEAVARKARLVWLSVSAVADERSLRAAVAGLGDSLAGHRIDLVLGGVNAAAVAPPGTTNASLINSMAELAAFARGILGRSKPARPRR